MLQVVGGVCLPMALSCAVLDYYRREDEMTRLIRTVTHISSVLEYQSLQGLADSEDRVT